MVRGSLARSLAIFGSLGAAASIVPSLIPKTASEIGVEAYELLPAIPLLFWGLFLGVLIGPRLAQARGSQVVVQIASTALAAGLAGVTGATSAAVFLSGGLVVGLGFGVIEVLVTAQVRIDGGDAARALTQLNIAFALGAVLSPVVLAVTMRLLETDAIGYLAALLMLLSGLSFRAANRARSTDSSKLETKPLRLFLLACALYVGAESILAGWTATIFSELEITSAELAPIGTTIFWGMLVLGRVSSLYLTPRYLSPGGALILWPVVSAAGLGLTFSFVGTAQVAAAGLAIASFAAGPIYGFLIAKGLEVASVEDSAKATRLLILAGSVGGFAIPALLQVDPSITLAAMVGAIAMFAVALLGALAARTNTNRERVGT